MKCPQCECDTREDLVRDGGCYDCRKRADEIGRGLRWASLVPLPEAKLWKGWEPLAKLGELVIYRSHRGYWVVKGRVPIETAKLLYADPLGRDVIRVNGHCMCPAPESPWVTWVAPDGRAVTRAAEEANFDRLIAAADSTSVFMRDAKQKYIFHDDPASIGAECFVDLYHIDGDAGLRVFCDIVRAQAKGGG